MGKQKPPVDSVPEIPAEIPNPGTIDLTDAVVRIKSAWISWATALVKTALPLLPYMGWLKLPLISTIFGVLANAAVTAIATAIEMRGFFMNTAIRKGAQAADLVAADDALAALPPTTTDAEYEEYEKRKMAAFRNLALVTN